MDIEIETTSSCTRNYPIWIHTINNFALELFSADPIEVKLKIIIQCPRNLNAHEFFKHEVRKQVTDFVCKAFPTTTSSNALRLKVGDDGKLFGYRLTFAEAWLDAPSNLTYISKIGPFYIRIQAAERMTFDIAGFAEPSRMALRKRYQELLKPLMSRFQVRCHDEPTDIYTKAQIVLGAIPKNLKGVCKIMFREHTVDLKWPQKLLGDIKYAVVFIDQNRSVKVGLDHALVMQHKYIHGEIEASDICKFLSPEGMTSVYKTVPTTSITLGANNQDSQLTESPKTTITVSSQESTVSASEKQVAVKEEISYCSSSRKGGKAPLNTRRV